MKIQTATLIGPALDWAVVECEEKLPASFDDWKQTWPHYSTQWFAGGPILEREKLIVGCLITGDGWSACSNKGGNLQYGPTPLIAVMRCYVASKLGDEVEIPEELT